MYKAAIFRYDFKDLRPPTAKEIQDYFKKSTRLLYGNKKRKSKSTQIHENLHLVNSSFETFINTLTGKSYISTMLYVFDDRANSSMLALKYANQVVCHFKLDEKIIDEMWNCHWNYEHLQRYKRGLQSAIDDTVFFVEKNIASDAFHKNVVPLFIKSTKAYITEVEQELSSLESEAKHLFNSGWD